jgi:hypothetical protein
MHRRKAKERYRENRRLLDTETGIRVIQPQLRGIRSHL